MVMDKINKVQLGLNNDMEVVVTSEVVMHDANDRDDVYFVMFNILDKPLRFVVSTAGNFTEFLTQRGTSAGEIKGWLDSNPDLFLNAIVQHQAELLPHSQEKVRVTLDSQKNADMARAVVSSMIDKKYFVNVSHYKIRSRRDCSEESKSSN